METAKLLAGTLVGVHYLEGYNNDDTLRSTKDSSLQMAAKP